jgi:hypothetical protein
VAPAPPRARWRRRGWEAEKWEALPQGTDEDGVVERAIAQLEEYAFRAGSDRVAAQADWVALDDPDLSGLRDRSELQLWASHHLPRRLPKEATSRKADVKRFTVRIAHEGALAFAASWRKRAEEAEPEAAEIAEWWRVETQIWKELGNTWREHLSWQQRLQWLKTLQEWLRASETRDKVDFSYEARGAAADAMSRALFDELAGLASDGASSERTPAPRSSPRDVLTWVGARAEHARVAHEAGENQADRSGALRAKVERREALRAVRVWTRLAEALELELERPCEGDSDEELRKRDEELRARMDLIRAELPARNRPRPTLRQSPAGLLQAARNRWSGPGRNRGRPR